MPVRVRQMARPAREANEGSYMGKAKLKVLYGEGEEEILKEQASAMEKAGHSVQPAVGRKAVQEALNKNKFDLVVLGPTLTRNDRHHLPYMVKKANAETSVLVMHADGSRHPYVDACTDTGSSMEHVLARMESMTITGMMPTAAAAGAGR
jgi:PleD family two-component response regulator